MSRHVGTHPTNRLVLAFDLYAKHIYNSIITFKEKVMENLWAPWRMEYIKKVDNPGCIFCLKPDEDKDVENYILHREKFNFVILNCYPYNPGHLMVSLPHLTTPKI